ncbi:biotin-protein ligase [Halorhodospira halochloris]|uniref:biotin--[biotin carboxyl-carrier protein] ligase n=1 Tax=Halorhodospira halochloris TaxID=1052 RepID=A0A0X8XBL1_HALHR|nr:biotin-protein ligase [Halorhodospira halochloris]
MLTLWLWLDNAFMGDWLHSKDKGLEAIFALLGRGGAFSTYDISKTTGIAYDNIPLLIEGLRELGMDIEEIGGECYQSRDDLRPLDPSEISKRAELNNLKISVQFQVESTNISALSMDLDEGEYGVVAAECQSAGKGRMGRSWTSPLGGVYISLVRDFSTIAAMPTALTIWCALSIVSSLNKFGVKAQLKWPNDILINARKAGGLLAELKGNPRGPCRIVVGIGLNTANQNLIVPKDELSNTGVSPLPVGSIRGLDRNRLVGKIAGEVHKTMYDFALGNLANQAAEWIRYDYFFGKSVEVCTSEGRFEGECRGVDGEGRLILRTDNNQIKFASGESRLRMQRC